MFAATVTLNFASLKAAHEALAKLADVPVNATVTPSAEPLPVLELPEVAPANPFAAGAAVVPVPPTLPAAPPAPSAPSAPSAATAPTGALPSGPDLDSKGMPWDGRIHGASKTKNADGAWRQRRGLNDEALKNRIEQELLAGQAARAPASGLLLPPPAPAPLPQPLPPLPDPLTAAAFAPSAATPSTSGLPLTTPAPSAPVPTPPPASAPTAAAAPQPPAAQSTLTTSPTETFGTFMARIAPLMATNPDVLATLNRVLATFNLTALSQLAARPDLVPSYAVAVDAALATSAATA